MAKKSSTKNKSILAGNKAADTLTVKHTQVTVNAGAGKDRINVNSGSKHKIYGEAGNDTIVIAAKAGSGSKIYGDDAKGKLTGKDMFTINGGKKNYFYGGKGDDELIGQGGKDWYVFSASDVVGYTKTIRNYYLNDIIKFQDDCTVKYHFGNPDTNDRNDVFLTVNGNGTIRVIDGKDKVKWLDHNNGIHQTFL